jgi:predicted amidohydrolase YtcJ
VDNVGWGYDQTEMADQRHPTRWDLDEAASDHKVAIFRTCGHLVVGNSLALKDCGYDRSTPDPEGGKLERDDRGRLTGLLIEQPRTALWNKTIPSQETFMKAWPLLNQDFLSLGITSAGEATGRIPHEITAMQDAVDQGLIQFKDVFLSCAGPARGWSWARPALKPA